jgi:hypothetical protein
LINYLPACGRPGTGLLPPSIQSAGGLCVFTQNAWSEKFSAVSRAGEIKNMQLAEKVMSNSASRAFNAPWTEVDEHELGRPHLRYRNPIVSGGLEGLRQAQYDIVRVDPSTAFPTITLFAIPVGGQYTQGVAVAFQKTLLHTSMKQYAVLQSPNKQLVRSIKVEVTGEPTSGGHQTAVNAQDALSFLYGTLFDFKINDKDYFIGTPSELPAGGGLFFSAGSATTVAATTTVAGVANNGYPDTRNMWQAPYDGISIEQTQTFGVILDGSQEAGGSWVSAAAGGSVSFGAGVGLTAKVLLDGILFRGIQ